MADADAIREPGRSGLVPGQAGAPADSSPTPQPTPTPGVPSAPAKETVMTLVDHLGELRSRLLKAVVAVVAFAAIGFWRASAIVDLLRSPIGDRRLVSLSAGGPFFLYIKVSLVVGLILGMPVILYQAW